MRPFFAATYVHVFVVWNFTRLERFFWWGPLSSNVFTICAVYWSLGRRGYFGVSNVVLVLISWEWCGLVYWCIYASLSLNELNGTIWNHYAAVSQVIVGMIVWFIHWFFALTHKQLDTHKCELSSVMLKHQVISNHSANKIFIVFGMQDWYIYCEQH